MDRRLNPYAPRAGLQPPEWRAGSADRGRDHRHGARARAPSRPTRPSRLARGGQNRAAQSVRAFADASGSRPPRSRHLRSSRCPTCWRPSCAASSTPSTCASACGRHLSRAERAASCFDERRSRSRSVTSSSAWSIIARRGRLRQSSSKICRLLIDSTVFGGGTPNGLDRRLSNCPRRYWRGTGTSCWQSR